VVGNKNQVSQNMLNFLLQKMLSNMVGLVKKKKSVKNFVKNEKTQAGNCEKKKLF